jgi:F-type H+-transporting ATPase subunit gamma
MASLHDIKRRIRSVRNTRQITRAMKMVSAAKMRKATERVISARPYAKSLQALLSGLAARVDAEDAPPLLAHRDRKEILLVVVTGDKGLCGAFNTNVIRAATHFIADREGEGKRVRLVTIGKKGTDFFRRRKWEIAASWPGLFARFGRQEAAEIATFLTRAFVGRFDDDGERVEAPTADAVYVVFNEFKSIIQQNLRTDLLLPVVAEEDDSGSNGVDYLFEPSAEAILGAILPRHIEFQLFRILLESAAAEFGARMTAMDGATKNAGEMIDRLTLHYNRARQARITKELIEIVSGAAAL